MIDSPLVTVIVPTADRPALLREALESVRHQSYRNTEVLVVADGGAGTVELPDDSRFRPLHRSVAGGPAAARNTGLSAAHGSFVAFVDDDDILTRDRLATGIRDLDGADVHLCAMAEYPGGENAPRLFTPKVRGLCGVDQLQSMPASVCPVLVRRDRALVFDESLRTSEDVDWWVRLLAEGVTITSTNEVGYLVRRHEGVRAGVGSTTRLSARQALLEKNAALVAGSRRARAYLKRRVAGEALNLGLLDVARSEALSSWLTHPNEPALRVLLAATRRLVNRQ